MAFTSKNSINLSLIENGWFFEKNDDWAGTCKGYDVQKILALKRSKFQEIFIFDSLNCRVMALDGVLQLDTYFEHIYHETLVHIPLFAHPKPENVLILGGGDGGCARECIKHQCVKNIVWVEIDKVVIDLCTEYFPTLFTEQLKNDKRIQLLIDDGIQYVKNAEENTFDVIVVDGSDPIGASPSNVLFTREFFEHCHRILRPGGVIINAHNDGVFETNNDVTDAFRGFIRNIRDIFCEQNGGESRCCISYCPMYLEGHIMFITSRKYSKDIQMDVRRPCRNISKDIMEKLQYYNDGIHEACFKLPTRFNRIQSKL